MKKFVLLSACLTALNGFSQSAASTNLNIQLNSIQSIKINEAQNDVTIALNTASEYNNGKASNQADHIEVMSTSNNEIKVSAASDLIGDTASINIGSVTVTPTLGSMGGPTEGSILLNPVALSLGESTIVQSSHGDIQRSFNVKYRVSGGAPYLNKPLGTYTTLVTYTILMP
jgi:hypothetical protein